MRKEVRDDKMNQPALKHAAHNRNRHAQARWLSPGIMCKLQLVSDNSCGRLKFVQKLISESLRFA